jgi:hypothetical protein
MLLLGVSLSVLKVGTPAAQNIFTSVSGSRVCACATTNTQKILFIEPLLA